MGNVPISCCRSKSPGLDSESTRSRNGLNAQYTNDDSPRRKLSNKLIRGGGGNNSFTDRSRSPQTSAQNILQHISEREPDDSETDPSSNPLNRPIFATRSTSSKNHHCRLLASSSTSNYNDSYCSDLSSSFMKKQISQNTPLTSSQDQGYNSSASTNLTHYDGNLLTTTTTSTTNTSFGGGSIPSYNQQQRIVDKINEQIHGLTTTNNQQSTSDNLNATSPDNLVNKSMAQSQLASPLNNITTDEDQTLMQSISKRRYCSVARNMNEGNKESCVDRLKASSCSTIFVDSSTISQPNLDQTIKCVSLAIYYHIQNRTTDDTVEIFDESIHPLKMPSQPIEQMNGNDKQPAFTRDELIILDTNSQQPQQSIEQNTSITKSNATRDFNEEPDQETIYEFVKTLFKAALLTSEYAITTLVYLERLMTYAEIDLTPKTWRRIFLGAILLSSKVWEDQAVWNVDYAQILEEISVDDINELERQFLELIQFNMNVPSSVYAKYYFHLRTLALKNGLAGEQTILTTSKARDLEAMSKVDASSRDWSTIDGKSKSKSIKKHTSLERLRSCGNSRAVLM